MRGTDRLPMLKMDFGDIKGSLPLDRLRASLQFHPDGIDGELLALVPQALRYVRQVQADDPVPTELQDGRPSWVPRPHVVQRAVALVWRAIQGPVDVLQSGPLPQRPDSADTDVGHLARGLLGLHPGITPAQAEATLSTVVNDIARVDWLRRAIATLQRTVGELAQLSAQHANTGTGDLARRSALQLRDITIWGTEKAIAADAAVGDINGLLAEPDLLRQKAWPAINALRVLTLDVEPIILLWQAARDRADGGPRMRDLEDILRLTLQRYAGFDPALFLPRSVPTTTGGLDD
ncbi:MAG: hypothetical protein VW600_11495 [Ferrovibrio sp.]